MTTTIVLPSSTAEKVNVKDAVLGVLSNEFPLSLKKIFVKVKKQYGLNVTYQGVRKAVNSLEDAKVIKKENLEYSISKDWILNARTFVQRLHETYFEARKGEAQAKVGSKSYKEFRIEALFELDNFWYSIIIDYINRAKNASKTSISITGNQWWMIINLGSETKLMRTIKQKGYKQFILCTKNNPLNEWAMRVYEKFSFPCKFVADKTNVDINVYGDLIIEVYYNETILKEIESLFSNVKEISDLDPLQLYNLGHKKSQLTIKIIEDPILAESIRQQVIRRFK